ncbi:hypothetical protein [Flavobacterium sp.]|uniref:hypothetical protein n=1 Tax=Flavobacterium sp. TaxID=239 RepID=UPI002611896E|nr:hypothetical protein [Flavobacterium sp.]
MYKYLLITLFLAQFSFSQVSMTTYKYGYNGMELIVKSKNETIIISTFNSKKAIKDEIAQKVYDHFKNSQINSGDTISIQGNDAKVTGKCFISRKKKLISINFYYEKIEWNNGSIELYKKT